MRPITCIKQDPPISVADYIVEVTAAWDLHRLREYFLPMDIEVIQSIPIGTARFDDFLAWHFERSGVFSVRSAYRMLVNSKQRREA